MAKKKAAGCTLAGKWKSLRSGEKKIFEDQGEDGSRPARGVLRRGGHRKKGRDVNTENNKEDCPSTEGTVRKGSASPSRHHIVKR